MNSLQKACVAGPMYKLSPVLKGVKSMEAPKKP